MPPKNIPTHAYYQEKVFFDEPWTRIVDKMFIHYLIEEHRIGRWVVGDRNHIAIEHARTKTNAHFSENFEYTYTILRTRKLHKRYKVFSWLINFPGVEYYPQTRWVYCSDETWMLLYQEEPLVAAYKKEGEHSFDGLRTLFERQVQPLAPPKNSSSPLPHTEVIQISSDTENQSTDSASVVEIFPEDFGYSSLHSSDYSSLNTDNSFWSEFAWMHHDSASENSRVLYDPTNPRAGPSSSKDKKGKKKVGDRSCGAGHEDRSSTASWSPSKKR